MTLVGLFYVNKENCGYMSNLAYAHKYHVSPKMLLFQSLFGQHEMDYSTIVTCYSYASDED